MEVDPMTHCRLHLYLHHLRPRKHLPGIRLYPPHTIPITSTNVIYSIQYQHRSLKCRRIRVSHRKSQQLPNSNRLLHALGVVRDGVAVVGLVEEDVDLGEDVVPHEVAVVEGAPFPGTLGRRDLEVEGGREDNIAEIVAEARENEGVRERGGVGGVAGGSDGGVADEGAEGMADENDF